MITSLIVALLLLIIVALILLVHVLRTHTARVRLEAEWQSLQQALKAAETQQQQWHDKWQSLHQQFDTLSGECESLKLEKVQQQAENKSQAEKLAWLDNARKQLAEEFRALSAKIFEERNEKLQQGNREGLEQLLKPFGKQLERFRERVDKVHNEDSQAQAGLMQQLKGLKDLNLQMQEDARSLTNALRGENKTQGNWGEMILARLLEEAGLQEGREYEAQSTHYSEEGSRQQPDVIVHLPDKKDIIIDSKVSLKAYETFTQSDDDALRQKVLKEHLESVRTHIKELSDKEYRSLKSVNSLDFVLLFIPVEGAFMVAIQGDSGLFQQAFDKNVVLVSPSTLMVTLRTIRNIWRYEDQNRNAIEIANRAGLICDQITRLEEAWRDVGQRLEKAQSAWDTANNRLSHGKGNLLRQAHQLQEMGAKAKKALPPVDDEE